VFSSFAFASTIDNVASMWGRSPKTAAKAEEAPPPRLKDAIRHARIEAADRSSVVVDLRDAELARLELLSEALDPVFAEIPPEIDLFDRGISRGDTPRLWIDAIAHVVMGRDKRVYRFVQDTIYGRRMLAESPEIEVMADAVTKYIARRLVERERALAADSNPLGADFLGEVQAERRRWRWNALKAFFFGLLAGGAALSAAAWLLAPPAN
jgi:hypothetical protein